MQNFINSVDDIVLDSMKGFCEAHKNIVLLHESPIYVTRAKLNPDKVAIVSGGGSGHEPLHAGFVGQGMLDAACPGQLLTSPTPDQIAAAITTIDSGNGVLMILKNYQGDRMNFELARSLVQCEVDMVLVSDDAAFVDCAHGRGIAGILVVEKMLGAAAERGEKIPALKQLADKVNRQTKSIGVALKSLTLPMSSEPMYELPVDKMEYGVGIHGEKGRERIDVLYAKDLVARMVEQAVEKLESRDIKELLLFVNGLGGTPLIELYIIYKEAAVLLEKKGYKVIRSLVGNYVTSLSMYGCSITVSAFDEECIEYWDASVKTPHLSW